MSESEPAPCKSGHDWCDGPESDLDDYIALGEICFKCHAVRERNTNYTNN